MEYGDQPDICLWKITNSLAIFKIEETTKNLNQVGRPRDLNPGSPECEYRALPRSHLARCKLIILDFRGNISVFSNIIKLFSINVKFWDGGNSSLYYFNIVA